VGRDPGQVTPPPPPPPPCTRTTLPLRSLTRARRAWGWGALHAPERPPYVPEVTAQDDASYFDDADLSERPPVLDTTEPRRRGAFSGHHLPFIGFSYNPAFHVSASRGGPAPPSAIGPAPASASAREDARVAVLEVEVARAKEAEARQQADADTCVRGRPTTGVVMFSHAHVCAGCIHVCVLALGLT
jgi:hypothetical protein